MKMAHVLALAASFVAVLSVGCSGADDSTSTESEEVRATKTLLCASSANEPVYYGRESQVLLTANVARDGILANAALSMSIDRNLGVSDETLTAQKRYAPTNPRYKDMQKYSGADNWCGYSIIAPQDLNGQTGKFDVFVQQACDGGFISTAKLSCKVETRSPARPDAPSAAAEVELRFSAAHKADVIRAGYYEAVMFRGNTIHVASTDTSIDIDNLPPDDGSESAPDSVCFTGNPTRAKKILFAMLGNTDGNGDHWLEEGATVVLKNDALVVDYTVIGEGGPVARHLSVPRCN